MGRVSFVYAEEFQAGSSAVLDILEHSGEQLHEQLLHIMPQLPPAATQVPLQTLVLGQYSAIRHCMTSTCSKYHVDYQAAGSGGAAFHSD